MRAHPPSKLSLSSGDVAFKKNYLKSADGLSVPPPSAAASQNESGRRQQEADAENGPSLDAENGPSLGPSLNAVRLAPFPLFCSDLGLGFPPRLSQQVGRKNGTSLMSQYNTLIYASPPLFSPARYSPDAPHPSFPQPPAPAPHGPPAVPDSPRMERPS